jgi:hypothetical protein
MSKSTAGYVVGRDGTVREVPSTINDNEYHMTYSAWTLEGNGWPDGKRVQARRTARGKTGARRKLVRLLKLQDNKCFFCGEAATTTDSNVDHVVPLSVGGSRKYNNLVASHKKCNSNKGSRLPTAEELEKLQRLHKSFRG